MPAHVQIIITDILLSMIVEGDYMTGETLEQFYMRKLPELRRKREVTRKDVAHGVGVTLGKYDKWETGKVLPKAGDVDRLAEYYGISIDEMLEITPEESAAINRQIIADAEHLPPELKENVLGMMRESHPELFGKMTSREALVP